MANWQRTIRLNPEWDQAIDGEITCQQLAASIAKKLKSIAPFGSDRADVNDELAELIERFDSSADDKTTDIPSIDYAMCDLYDWGDISLDGEWNGKKVCFIDTFSAAKETA